jgi:hypothetical protein
MSAPDVTTAVGTEPPARHGNPEGKPISSADLRRQIATAEASIPALTDAAAAAGLASYGAPGDAALRHAADTAMSALQAAQDELTRLRIALPAAEQNEAANAETRATADRQRQKDKLIREQDRVFVQWNKETDYIDEKSSALDAAIGDRDELIRLLDTAEIKVSVLLENIASANHRRDGLADEHLDLEERIAATPVTTEEVEAHEAREQVAREAEAAEKLRLLNEATDRELIESYDNAIVEVSAPYTRNGAGWATCRNGEMARMPRHRVATHERDMAEAVAWIGRQEDERLERARRQDELFERNRKLDQRDNDEPTVADFLAAQKFNRENGGV